MPALVLLGRRLLIASDDVPLIALPAALLHTGGVIALLVGLWLSHQHAVCRKDGPLLPFLSVAAAAYSTAAVLEWALVREGLKGRPLETKARRRVPWLLGLHAGASAVEVAVAAFGAFLLATRAELCADWSPRPLAAALVGASWGLIGFNVLLTAVAYNPWHGLGLVEAWESFFLALSRLLCCRTGLLTRAALDDRDPALKRIASLTSRLLQHVDLTLSDVAAAMLLVAAAQRERRRRALRDAMVAAAAQATATASPPAVAAPPSRREAGSSGGGAAAAGVGGKEEPLSPFLAIQQPAAQAPPALEPPQPQPQPPSRVKPPRVRFADEPDSPPLQPSGTREALAGPSGGPTPASPSEAGPGAVAAPTAVGLAITVPAPAVSLMHPIVHITPAGMEEHLEELAEELAAEAAEAEADLDGGEEPPPPDALTSATSLGAAGSDLESGGGQATAAVAAAVAAVTVVAAAAAGEQEGTELGAVVRSMGSPPATALGSPRRRIASDAAAAALRQRIADAALAAAFAAERTTVDRDTLEEALVYGRYAAAVYGGYDPHSQMAGGGARGSWRDWRPRLFARRGPATAQDAMREAIWDSMHKLTPYVAYVNTENSAEGYLPYAVCLDEATRSVVISIRGTSSAEDIVTDCLIAPYDVRHLLPPGLLPPKGAAGGEAPVLVHGGIWAAADAVLADLKRLGLLELLFPAPPVAAAASSSSAAPAASAAAVPATTATSAPASALASAHAAASVPETAPEGAAMRPSGGGGGKASGGGSGGASAGHPEPSAAAGYHSAAASQAADADPGPERAFSGEALSISSGSGDGGDGDGTGDAGAGAGGSSWLALGSSLPRLVSADLWNLAGGSRRLSGLLGAVPGPLSRFLVPWRARQRSTSPDTDIALRSLLPPLPPLSEASPFGRTSSLGAGDLSPSGRAHAAEAKQLPLPSALSAPALGPPLPGLGPSRALDPDALDRNPSLAARALRLPSALARAASFWLRPRAQAQADAEGFGPLPGGTAPQAQPGPSRFARGAGRAGASAGTSGAGRAPSRTGSWRGLGKGRGRGKADSKDSEEEEVAIRAPLLADADVEAGARAGQFNRLEEGEVHGEDAECEVMAFETSGSRVMGRAAEGGEGGSGVLGWGRGASAGPARVESTPQPTGPVGSEQRAGGGRSAGMRARLQVSLPLPLPSAKLESDAAEASGSGARPWRVVVTGHSLGGGAAALLAMRLRAALPHVEIKAWAFAPPGSLAGPELCTILESCCISVVAGKDLIPRLSPQTMERYRDEMVTALARCSCSKVRVLLGSVSRAHRLRRAARLLLPYDDLPQEAAEALWRYHRAVQQADRLPELHAPGKILYLQPSAVPVFLRGASSSGGSGAGSGTASPPTSQPLGRGLRRGAAAGPRAAPPALRYRPVWVSADELSSEGILASSRMLSDHSLTGLTLPALEVLLRQG
ncbi:hypothetical protein HYH03_002354 [Edaphochlamys debaryana]|uniref:sn-1-specific diacylglycerol lipase n=1 Tax=Edaphochlamys debaryana TaxID=47281 RepID=A0A835YEC1_9CHLO|nr:hypothetical protein HYH03_002354 [Edaphochlamys debaryana]|eukprot:KAG2500077.1 hypothetical protein HYH03_002354 [Edaphochlamys debaryana]